ncbi:MAG: hypothetical protein ACPL4K_04095, partial [Candidatus Margulisiibacteriota bacterium]
FVEIILDGKRVEMCVREDDFGTTKAKEGEIIRSGVEEKAFKDETLWKKTIEETAKDLRKGR